MKQLGFLFLLSSFLVRNSLGQEQNGIQRALNTFVTAQDLKGAAISIHVIDIANGEEIASYNKDIAIIPASTVKLFTTATAYEYLGAYHKPVTKLYYTGEINPDSVLKGNIIIQGFGDPTLGSKFFNKEGDERQFFTEWVNGIKELGIKQIEGYVLADASALGYDGAPAGWTWGDMGNYYGAWPSGLTLFDNMTGLYFSTPKTAKDSASLDCIDPYIPNFFIQNRVVGGNVRGDNAYVFGAPFSKDWFVEGLLPLNQTDFKVKAAIPDPEELIAMEFTSTLKQNGIDVKYHYQMMRKQKSLKDAYYNDAKLIMEYFGKDINNIAHWVNQRSVNLFAEHLICLLALKKHQVGNTSNGVQALLDFWKGKIDLSTIRITDGSGLSRSNAIAASHFTQLLIWMSKNGSKEFEKSLPIAGKTGTLANVAKNQAAHGRVFAKSGTMSRVKSYAGYVNAKSGKKLAFAIIVNNHTNSSGELTKQIATLFNAMASF